ncbi:endothelin converting enzyme 2, isoform CRA_e, partial [Mus musculus]
LRKPGRRGQARGCSSDCDGGQRRGSAGGLGRSSWAGQPRPALRRGPALLHSTMNVALHELGGGGSMVEYKRAKLRDEESPEITVEGRATRDSLEVGFQKRTRQLFGSHTQLELVLAGLILVLAALLLGCLVALWVHRDPAHSTCVTEACIRVAGKILESLDRGVSPCQDFYQFSCGGWIRRNPLPNGRSRWNTFNSLWDQNQAILKHLLENTTFNSSSEAERKTRSFYLSCLQSERIEKLGAKPLRDLIDKIGGWNITGPWDEDSLFSLPTWTTWWSWECCWVDSRPPLGSRCSRCWSWRYSWLTSLCPRTSGVMRRRSITR